MAIDTLPLVPISFALITDNCAHIKYRDPLLIMPSSFVLCPHQGPLAGGSFQRPFEPTDFAGVQNLQPKLRKGF